MLIVGLCVSLSEVKGAETSSVGEVKLLGMIGASERCGDYFTNARV